MGYGGLTTKEACCFPPQSWDTRHGVDENKAAFHCFLYTARKLCELPKTSAFKMAWTEYLLRVQIWLALVTADASAARIHLQIFPLITSDNIYNGDSFYSSTSNESWLWQINRQYFGHLSAAVRTGSDLGTPQSVTLNRLMADLSRLHPTLAKSLMACSISSLPCWIKGFICGAGRMYCANNETGSDPSRL